MFRTPQQQDAAIQLLLDERDIRALLHRYGTALDGKDWKLLESCFVSDALVTYETIGDLHGSAAVVDICRTALVNMTQTQHLIGNVEINVDRDSANSTCYLHAQHVRAGTPGGDTNIMAGRYDDELVRTDQGWRIRRRILRIWWTFGNPRVHELS